MAGFALAVPLGGWQLLADHVAWWPVLRDPGGVLVAALFVEAGAALVMSTVVDIASRLRRPPRWWTVALIALGILLMYPDEMKSILDAIPQGGWVALPVLATVGGRFADLWTLPGQSPLEKKRRRALIFGRMYTVVVLAGIVTALLLVEAILVSATGWRAGEDYLIESLLPWFAVAFYGICAFDAVRVQGKSFADRPRNLWPRLDQGDSARLDPL